MGNWAVCVECMSCPLATWTAIGLGAGHTLVRLCGDAKKWPVLPESMIIGGAGPGVVGAVLSVYRQVAQLVWVPGVPLTYSCFGEGCLRSSRVCRGCLAGRSLDW